MPRRRKDDDQLLARAAVGIAVALVGLGILIHGSGNPVIGICIIVFALTFILLIGFLAYKIATTKRVSTGSYTAPYPASPTASTTAKTAKNPSSKPLPVVLATDPVPYSKPEAKPIDRLREIDWYQFERFVAYVYEEHGFDVTRKGGANPDGGIDMVIEKNGQRFAVQCKQWKTWNVGVKAIREFLGALADSKIEKGIFITLNGYTSEAKQLAEKHGIEIINEAGLRRVVEGLDLRNPKVQEIFNDTRKICPKCERPLVLRTARKGPNARGQFWGCSGFPQGCRFTMPV